MHHKREAISRKIVDTHIMPGLLVNDGVSLCNMIYEHTQHDGISLSYFACIVVVGF